MDRRNFLAASTALILGSSQAMSAPQPASGQTFVFVHGAWGGGWDWRTVANLLAAKGHVAFRPTLTGLGERAHLSSPDIGLSTHITDIENTILFERLTNVTLVGHSYGGMVITGVADRIPERISRLVYVDAFIPENGDSLMSLNAARGALLPGEVQGAFRMPTWVKPGTPPPTDVPQPMKTLTEAIVLTNPLRSKIPTTYILATELGAPKSAFDVFAARAKAKAWQVERLISDHNVQRSVPKELVTLLENAR